MRSQRSMPRQRLPSRHASARSMTARRPPAPATGSSAARRAAAARRVPRERAPSDTAGVRMGGLQREACLSADGARPGSGRAADAQASARWPLDWLVAGIPALAELAVGGYRIGAPSLWRDEAATISGSQRSLSATVAMVQNQDAVHGPYYVLMHAVIAAGGISATTLRLPSLIAMCLAAGLTAALGRRLAQSSGLPGARAVGLLAGLALPAPPLTPRYPHAARPSPLPTPL